MKKHLPKLLILLASVFILQSNAIAQGTWKTLTNAAPDPNGGVMILLTDGTVMVLTGTGSGGYGNTWDLLTPDSKGSYLNGTWTTLPTMNDTRLYCATQVLASGNVYVAGGEYGSGGNSGELYNTTSKTWKYITGAVNGWQMSDGNSEILYDGTVIEGVQQGSSPQSSDNLIYTESTNAFTAGAGCFGSHDEAAWVKLKDSSIMNVDIGSESLERYIPQQKKWVTDANVPVPLYDGGLYETGPAIMLPNGKVLFLGDSNFTAIYTPSGSTANGSWITGVALPSPLGVRLGCPDAPAAMMPNGNILCSFSPAGTYNTPTYFYEYNYLTNTFTQVTAPGGGTGDTLAGVPAYSCTMLDLPDGTVLFADQGDQNYYQYTPSGSPIAAGKPTIDNIIDLCPNFKITGKLFNGISEGAGYGDDWQMETNYPIVRLTSGTNVWYARTSKWNRIGAVMTGTLEDTAYFTIPSGMAAGTYQVQVIANGIASSTYSLSLPCVPQGIQQVDAAGSNITVYPNPSKGVFSVQLANGYQPMANSSIEVFNMLGKQVMNKELRGTQNEINLTGQPAGVYFYRVLNTEGTLIGSGKLVVQK